MHNNELTAMRNVVILRILIGVSFVFGIIGSKIDSVLPKLIQFEEIKKAVHAQVFSSLPMIEIVAVLIYLLIVLAIGLFANIGLWLLKRWARSLAVWFSALSLVICPVLGFFVYSGWAFLFLVISYASWGAVLSMIYFSDLKEFFEK